MNNNTTMRDTRETTLTSNTKISLQLLIIIMPPLIGIALLYLKLDALQQDVRNNWTMQHQVVWSERLGAQNPSLKIPAVDDVHRLVRKQQ